MTGHGHDLINTCVMHRSTSNEPCPQGMPSDILWVKSHHFRVMLDDSRNIAVVHSFSTQLASSLHGLKERARGYARIFQPLSKTAYWTNQASAWDWYPLPPSLLVGLRLPNCENHTVLTSFLPVKEFDVINIKRANF